MNLLIETILLPKHDALLPFETIFGNFKSVILFRI